MVETAGGGGAGKAFVRTGPALELTAVEVAADIVELVVVEVDSLVVE